ncbi:MAG: hypothetical protein WA213_20690 [Terriglobales bacterium]
MSDFKNFKAFVPYVNRPDLLRRAVESIAELQPHLSIVDNSEDGLTQEEWPVPVLRPSVPLSVSHTMRFIYRLTREAGCQVCVYMHGDGYAQPGVALELLECARKATMAGRRWGVMFTLYDILFAMNMDLLKAVGDWDPNLPWYCADQDYYRRVTLAGLEAAESGLGDRVEHFSSATIRSDKRIDFINSIMHPLAFQYYERKWGGRCGQERWTIPFNRPDLFHDARMG